MRSRQPRAVKQLARDEAPHIVVNIAKLPELAPKSKCKRKRPPESWRPKVGALLRADMCKGVAPLPLLADCWGATGSRAAGAPRTRLLTLGAARDHALMRMRRVSQSNRHDNCKQRYSKSPQHSFFLPRYRNSEISIWANMSL